MPDLTATFRDAGRKIADAPDAVMARVVGVKAFRIVPGPRVQLLEVRDRHEVHLHNSIADSVRASASAATAGARRGEARWCTRENAKELKDATLQTFALRCHYERAAESPRIVDGMTIV